MHSLSLQGKMGIPLVFLFKEKLLIVKLGCQKKETLNKAVFLASAYCTKAYKFVVVFKKPLKQRHCFPQDEL